VADLVAPAYPHFGQATNDILDREWDEFSEAVAYYAMTVRDYTEVLCSRIAAQDAEIDRLQAQLSLLQSQVDQVSKNVSRKPVQSRPR
jgi:uncharacterized small protein (DUF1192 family)